MGNDYEETKGGEWVFIIMFALVGILGNVAMLVCGSLGIAGILDINFGGSIAMVVLGALFGGIPLLKIFI